MAGWLVWARCVCCWWTGQFTCSRWAWCVRWRWTRQSAFSPPRAVVDGRFLWTEVAEYVIAISIFTHLVSKHWSRVVAVPKKGCAVGEKHSKVPSKAQKYGLLGINQLPDTNILGYKTVLITLLHSCSEGHITGVQRAEKWIGGRYLLSLTYTLVLTYSMAFFTINTANTLRCTSHLPVLTYHYLEIHENTKRCGVASHV